MRDVVVLSGWRWSANNVPERIARAFALAGSRVLYCELPRSLFRDSVNGLTEAERNLFIFCPLFLGHRFYSYPFFSQIQTRLLINQIIQQVYELKLKDPICVYPHGVHLPLCEGLKNRGFQLIHVCMDYEPETQMAYVRLADFILVIPRSVFRELEPAFGAKIRLIPQLSTFKSLESICTNHVPEPADIASIPRPRLVYFGNLAGRTSITLLSQFLSKCPEWQFISFGDKKWLHLPNEHVLSWRPEKPMQAVLAGTNVGFMPYDCSSPKNFHCVPLKLFDYFARGIPVVSTPIAYLREYEDLVYLGDTAESLIEATRSALSEPTDSPKRSRRVAMVRNHTLMNIAQILAPLVANE